MAVALKEGGPQNIRLSLRFATHKHERCSSEAECGAHEPRLEAGTATAADGARGDRMAGEQERTSRSCGRALHMPMVSRRQGACRIDRRIDPLLLPHITRVVRTFPCTPVRIFLKQSIPIGIQ